VPHSAPMTCSELENPSPARSLGLLPFRTAAVDENHLLHSRPDLWPDLITWNLLALAAADAPEGQLDPKTPHFP